MEQTVTKLPSIQGLRDGRTITVCFEDPLFQLIESQCRAEWLELNRIDHPNDTASPFVPYDELMRTEEGRTHMYLVQMGFYIKNSIPGYPIQSYGKGLDYQEYNALLSRLQAQRYTTRGTRKRVEKRAHSATDYRKFRNWWINQHYAKALGLVLSAKCPFEKFKPEGPTESYIEMGKHFEEWTGYKLQKELWAKLKAREAERLAKLGNQQELQTA